MFCILDGASFIEVKEPIEIKDGNGDAWAIAVLLATENRLKGIEAIVLRPSKIDEENYVSPGFRGFVSKIEPAPNLGDKYKKVHVVTEAIK